MLVTVSGPPGSGTSTVSHLVASALDLPVVSGGQIFRALAAEHAMTLAQFGEHAARHPEVDVELDRRLEEQIRTGGRVVESRLAGFLAHRAAVASVRVLLEGDEDVRAARVAEREGIDHARALEDNRAREALERRRYRSVHGFDLEDRSVYGLVLDTTTRSPGQLARDITVAARTRFG